MDLLPDWEMALGVISEVCKTHPIKTPKNELASQLRNRYNTGDRSLLLYNQMLALEDPKEYVERIPE